MSNISLALVVSLFLHFIFFLVDKKKDAFIRKRGTKGLKGVGKMMHMVCLVASFMLEEEKKKREKEVREDMKNKDEELI